MNYSIGDFSKLTHLGIHTLRYYEKEGLITPGRNSANRRCYSDKDAEWIQFIKRLKDTGMPIKEIQRYARLRREGDATLEERLELLICHRKTLEAQMIQMQGHMVKLDEKIMFYCQKVYQMGREQL